MMLLLVVLESGPRLSAFGARLSYYSESPRKVRSVSQTEPVRRLEESRREGGILIYQSDLRRADWPLRQYDPVTTVHPIQAHRAARTERER